MQNDQQQKETKRGLTITLNWKVSTLVLLVVVAAMLFIWKPWNGMTASTRKITVTGQATVKSTPDEYILSPYFEFTNADRTKANAELSVQSNAITTKLKELGVKDEQIKSNTSGYDKYSYPAPADNSTNTLMLNYTVTLTDKDTAQKVQDYMLSLKAKGQISPQATFSQAKQKELQAQAREKAIEDAKNNANATAKQLQAKVGKVIEVSDGQMMGGGPIAISARGMSSLEATTDVGTISSPPIQVGQDEYSYSVSVEYELR